MSSNLVELVRRHHAPVARRHCRCSRRRWTPAARSPTRTAGVPPRSPGCRRRPSTASRPSTTICCSRAATVTSGSAPAPRASPRPAMRTSASSRGALGLELGERSEDGSVSLAETVCLGFCHSSPAVRDGDRDRRRRRGRRAGARRRRHARGARARVGQHARRAGPDPARGLVGPGSRDCRARRQRSSSRRCKAADVRGSRRAPASRPASKWEFARGAPGEPEVHRRQRRRGRPGLLHRQVPDGAQPGAGAGGDGARRLRGRRRRTASSSAAAEYPLLEARARGGRRWSRPRGGVARRGHRAAAASTSTSP